MEEIVGLNNIENLRRSLEEAEIIKTGMKLILMNPSLDSEHKGKYEKAFSRLSDQIRELKMMMDSVRNGIHSPAINKNEV